jgi:hypothetical protein
MSLLDDASLLVTPNAYKEGKLYSVIPSNGNGDFSVTRATTATRVNAAGLVELVPYNLLRYSEQFENAAWVKFASASVTANTEIAPNGTLTADTITLSSLANSRVEQAISTLVSGATYTFSIYLKVATGTLSVRLRGIDTTSGTAINVTDQWVRYSITQVASSSERYPAIVGNLIAGPVYAWGAQLVEGTSALDYQATETRLNIPRLDYSLGSCPNILLEPQRTNLALNSGELNSWLKIDTSVTSNSTISPDGTQNADTVIATGSGSLAHLIYQNLSFTSGTAYTYSVFAKANTSNFIQIVFSGDFVLGSYANFDLSNGTITASANLTPKIESIGNGWYRCSISATAGVSSINSQIIYLINSGTASRGRAFTANGESVYLWGGQFEAGAYPTSYIPTSSASVTRNADVISRGNIFTNGLITASGGTWFVDLRNNIPMIRDFLSGGIFINTGTAANTNTGFAIRQSSGSNQRSTIFKVEAGSGATIYNTTTDIAKIAIKWNGTTADVFVNGVKVVAATAFTATNMENLIGEGQNRAIQFNSMALYPTPLTDTQCIALTT